MDPAFVQSMFVEITHGNSTQVEHFMDRTLFKDLGTQLNNANVQASEEVPPQMPRLGHRHRDQRAGLGTLLARCGSRSHHSVEQTGG